VRRGWWDADSFFQLCIFAFVLGSTWRKLPSPYEHLLDYFLWMAERQEKAINEVVEQSPARFRHFNVNDI
jgi:hypothetical protein